MEQELLQKVFEVVTNMQKEIGTISNKIDNVESKMSARIDEVESKLSEKIETLTLRVDKLETIVDTLKDLPQEVRKINKKLTEINSNIRYSWEDFKLLEERVQKKEYSEVR